MMFAGMIATNANAQKVDRTKYPDYDPEIRPDFSLLQPRLNSAVKTAGGSSATAALPDHVNNAQLKFFPPIINQDGGSCAPASRICYMLAYELNAFRNADGKRPENRYPSHFVWLHTYGNSGKDEFVTKIGVPNAPPMVDSPIPGNWATRKPKPTTLAGCKDTTSGTPPCSTAWRLPYTSQCM